MRRCWPGLRRRELAGKPNVRTDLLHVCRARPRRKIHSHEVKLSREDQVCPRQREQMGVAEDLSRA